MPAKPKISKNELNQATEKEIKRQKIRGADVCLRIAQELVEKSAVKIETVKNPAYYGGVDNPYEVIKVCEAWGLDKDAYLFNVVKYVARAGKKDPQKELEDLKKAIFYLNRKVENLQK
jgi:hypothetical protein